MRKMNNKRNAEFKATVAFEAAIGQKTIAQLASEYGVHPNQTGQLKVELDWLKKVPGITAKEKRTLIETANIEIPISRQCDLLGLSR